jgi:hypothetical protein
VNKVHFLKRKTILEFEIIDEILHVQASEGDLRWLCLLVGKPHE